MPKGIFTPFTDAQKQKILDNYLTTPVKQLAAETNSSYGRIMRFLKNNNIEFPREIIEQRKIDNQFKKDEIAWNKGKKQSEYMSSDAIQRSAKTRFKKGNVPPNTNPEGDGAISRRKDSSGNTYKYIRIKKSIWEPYHRVIWERENGKIPEGHIVVFKDGNSENTNIDNLELITMTENMLRNSVQRFPPEIRKNIQLIGAINRQINKKRNEK